MFTVTLLARKKKQTSGLLGSSFHNSRYWLTISFERTISEPVTIHSTNQYSKGILNRYIKAVTSAQPLAVRG